MTKRPHSITVISWIFILFGSVALLKNLLPPIDSAAAQRMAGQPFEFWLIQATQALAVLCGVSMVYGFNWGRWLLVVWVGSHVIISIFHSALEVIVHSLLFSVLLYFVFRPQASAYFRAREQNRPIK
jgi:hypothetical protein